MELHALSQQCLGPLEKLPFFSSYAQGNYLYCCLTSLSIVLYVTLALIYAICI